MGLVNKKKSGLGLNLKFMLFVNPLFFIMGSILAVILIINFNRSSQEQLQSRGQGIANNIAMNSLGALSKNDPSLLKPIMNGLGQETDIVYGIVLNAAGEVVADTDETQIGKTLTDPLTLQALKTNQTSLFRFSQGSESYYDIVAPVVYGDAAGNPGGIKDGAASGSGKAGVVRLGVSLKRIQGELQHSIFLTVTVLGILVVSGVFISLFFVRLIIAPLERMTHVAEQIAGGDFSQTIEATTADEVGILADAFSQMSGSLKGMIRQIHSVSQQVGSVANDMLSHARRLSEGAVQQAREAEKTSSSIEEMNASVKNTAETIDSLSSSAEETSSSLLEMSSAINQVADNTNTLSSSVDETTSSLVRMSDSIQKVVERADALSVSAQETTTSIGEMNSSIREVETSAKESALLTETVSKDAAELGTVAIEKTVEGMEKIKNTVEKASQVINKLSERTEHIGKIVTVIEEVTRQTNLLALNAAILAAQAGEQGKGFSIVADEIKNLAEKTSASTQEIAQLIKNVQSEAKDAVESIHEGAQSVQEGIQLSINARQSLGKILEGSKRSSEMSRRIEKLTLDQVQAAAQVVRLMEKMNAMTKDVNSTMKEMERGILNISEAEAKMGAITRQVKIATGEQAKGSRQISGAVENVTVRIQQIAKAMTEQKQGNEVIRKSIIEIHDITRQSVQMAQEMSGSVEDLMKQSDLLKDEMTRFKIS